MIFLASLRKNFQLALFKVFLTLTVFLRQTGGICRSPLSEHNKALTMSACPLTLNQSERILRVLHRNKVNTTFPSRPYVVTEAT